MEFSEVISTRRAIRKYKKDHVSEEKLARIYEAIHAAPSGNNHQPYKFIFVKDAEQRLRIASEACHQEFLFEAPVLMVACCEKNRAFDVAIAVDHLVLAAINEGLSTCWVGWFEKDIVREILSIPEDIEIAILVSIGYGDENPPAKERKSIDELIRIDRYS
ncbi:MAG: nitroreductase family protein [Gorillibacterium sp.]|nr:nitroreductase family protein [Gorillibacterium sp.]